MAKWVVSKARTTVLYFVKLHEIVPFHFYRFYPVVFFAISVHPKSGRWHLVATSDLHWKSSLQGAHKFLLEQESINCKDDKCPQNTSLPVAKMCLL